MSRVYNYTGFLWILCYRYNIYAKFVYKGTIRSVYSSINKNILHNISEAENGFLHCNYLT